MKKEYVQYGKTLLAIQLLVITGVVATMFLVGFNDPFQTGILLFVLATFVLTTLTFYKLTITIDETHFTFTLGIGLIRKSYLLSDIQSCTPIKNSVFSGLGIHLTSGGWLYNVSGSYSVELQFKTHANSVRIGTDRPDEIAAEVASRIGTQHGSSYYESSGKSKMWIAAILLPLVIFGAVALLFVGNRETKFTMGSDALTIGGMYGTVIQFSEMQQADTVAGLPPIRMRTNGYAAGNVLKGHFRLKDGSDVMLFISNDSPPFLKIITGKDTYYLNGATPSETRSILRGINTGKK